MFNLHFLKYKSPQKGMFSKNLKSFHFTNVLNVISDNNNVRIAYNLSIVILKQFISLCKYSQTNQTILKKKSLFLLQWIFDNF